MKNDINNSGFVCSLCPRSCSAYRNEETGSGYCRSGTLAKVARAEPHMWEEPCISGTNGSGTVFFCGCSLGCVYCQNHRISGDAGFSAPLYDSEGLRKLYDELISRGVHNINLVTPTHYTRVIIDSIGKGLSVPIIWNTGGYEKAETIDMLRGKVQIFLTDMKYSEKECAEKYSNAPDYPNFAKESIQRMFDTVGPYRIDENGIMQSGVIIRHMMIPGELDNTFGVLDWVSENFREGDVLFSLMSQYTPQEFSTPYENLKSRVTMEEYTRAYNYMMTLGIFDGYSQDPDSADSSYTPDFIEKR